MSRLRFAGALWVRTALESRPEVFRIEFLFKGKKQVCFRQVQAVLAIFRREGGSPSKIFNGPHVSVWREFMQRLDAPSECQPVRLQDRRRDWG